MTKHKQQPDVKPGNEEGLFRITAKVAIIGPDGKVLLLTRTKSAKRGPGASDLPGGHVDTGETPEDTIRREVAEETGLAVRDITPLPTFEVFTGEDGLSIQKLRFIAFTDGTEVKTDPDEHSAFEWLTLDEAIAKLSDEGYEEDKRETLILAKEYLANHDSLGGWKRCLADFENFKKRQEASQKEMGKFLVERLLNDLAPVLDNFHAAASHVPEASKGDPWVTGIGYIEKQLEDVLAQHGVRVIEVKEGDAFDPSRHEALSDESTEVEAKENGELKTQTVVKVLQNGYMIGDKVVRAAKVTVR
jgi:molecular chaperone GrpE (heat shock protein)